MPFSDRGSSVQPTVEFPSLGDQQAYWDTRWSQTPVPNDWSLRRGDAILNVIASLSLNRPRILDVGCGTGWFTRNLSQVGEVTGVDLSPEAIAIARRRSPELTFLAGDLYDLDLPSASFDLVVAQEVIAHVEDQVTFLARVAELLRPSGYLVVTTVNKLVIARVDFGPDHPAHIKQWLSLTALKRLLASRFRILSTTTVLPMGTRGFLRVVNSYKLNKAVGTFISPASLERLKERAGLGYTRIVLAQRSR